MRQNFKLREAKSMVGYTVNTGSSKDFADGWDRIFSGGSTKSVKKKAAKKASKKKPVKKKAAAKKKSAKKASKKK